jgi:hypothetical protein
MRFTRAVLILSFFPSFGLQAQSRPDFSGNWRLNAEKSNFGGLSFPAKMTRKVVHEGQDLAITTYQADRSGETTAEAKYAIDGKEWTNALRGGDVKSVLKWDGGVLVVNWKRDVRGTTLSAEERWTLSPDGKTLTQDSTIDSPNGVITLKLIFEKVVPGAKPEVGPAK